MRTTNLASNAFLCQVPVVSCKPLYSWGGGNWEMECSSPPALNSYSEDSVSGSRDAKNFCTARMWRWWLLQLRLPMALGRRAYPQPATWYDPGFCYAWKLMGWYLFTQYSEVLQPQNSVIKCMLFP